MIREAGNQINRSAAVGSAAAVALLLAPLGGCATGAKGRDSTEVQFAAAEPRKRPRPPQEKQPQRPIQQKQQPRPESQRPKRPQPRPEGSGDPMPVASITIESPEVGAPIRGLGDAVWADRNNDGYIDGYVYNGQYYAGAPSGYDAALGRVMTGSTVGGALGAAAGAIIPGVSVLEGAVIGTAVGGLPGAVWADQNNDGVVDGYIYDGQYYHGNPPATAPIPAVSGERG